MIVRAGTLALVLLVALLLETVVFARLAVAGHAPAIVTLTVVAIGLADGAERGARYGFAAGLASDLVGGGLLGLQAIVLVLVGWGSGVVRGYLLGPPALTQALVGGLATAAAGALSALLTFLLDPQTVTLAAAARSALGTGIYSAALAPFVIRVVAAVSRRLAAVPASGRR